jgi:hypothetical protein
MNGIGDTKSPTARLKTPQIFQNPNFPLNALSGWTSSSPSLAKVGLRLSHLPSQY